MWDDGAALYRRRARLGRAAKAPKAPVAGQQIDCIVFWHRDSDLGA